MSLIDRRFRPGPALAIKVALLLLAAVVIFFAGVRWARDRHAARTAEQRICVAELRELRTRNPFVERYVMPADPCIALAVVRGNVRSVLVSEP